MFNSVLTSIRDFYSSKQICCKSAVSNKQTANLSSHQVDCVGLLSIIVPTYKSAKTIKQCLQSILRQTYQNFEIVVVYKDSQDDTLQIIQSLNDKRIRTIEQTDNTGPGGARNIGVIKANGDWIGFVEADDCLCEDFYSKLVAGISNNDVDIVCGEINANGKYMNKHKKDGIYSSFYEKFNLIRNGATFDKIFKKELIISHNIKCSDKIRWEDNIFIFKAFYYARKIKTVSNAIYFYNVSPWSAEYKAILQNDVVPEVEEIIEFINKNKFNFFQRDLAYRKIIKSFAGNFIQVPEIYSQMKSLMNSPYFFIRLNFKTKIKNIKKILRKGK